MSVVLPAVVCCLLISASRLLPVCSAVDYPLEPSHSVPALENEEALVVRSALLANLVLHNEVLELLLLLIVLPELVVVCRVVDGEAPPLALRFLRCH